MESKIRIVILQLITQEIFLQVTKILPEKARTIPTMPQQDLSMTLQIILRLTQVVL